VIVDQAIYRNGRREVCGDLSDELDALRSGEDATAFLWIGLKDPTDVEFEVVNEELQLHPLAVEDAVKGNQRPKVELYDRTMFVVLKTLRYVEETSDIETGEVMVFIGHRFVVTVRRGDANPLAAVRRGLEAEPERLRHGEIAVLHAIMDSVVDSYTAIDSELQVDLEDIEEAVFDGDRAVDSASIYRLKREVLEFRRAAAPLAGPLRILHDGSRSPLPSKEVRLLLRDVADHLLRVIDHIESYDRLLTDVLSAHLAQISVQQNSGHAQDLGLGGDRCRPDDDRRHLRHELRAHARAAFRVGLPGSAGRDGAHLRLAVPGVPPLRVALTRLRLPAAGQRRAPRPGAGPAPRGTRRRA
jgi:magnesium transporter